MKTDKPGVWGMVLWLHCSRGPPFWTRAWTPSSVSYAPAPPAEIGCEGEIRAWAWLWAAAEPPFWGAGRCEGYGVNIKGHEKLNCAEESPCWDSPERTVLLRQRMWGQPPGLLSRASKSFL